VSDREEELRRRVREAAATGFAVAGWPTPEESREIMHDLCEQVEPPFPPGTPLPADPDPGEED
jgi:tryptophan synthase alpha subunit